jgi:hypothetical protein
MSEKIDDAKFKAFAYEVLHSSFGVCEICPDDIHVLGLRFGLLFEDEANENDCEIWNEVEPGDTVYRIHADVTPLPPGEEPVMLHPTIPEV